MRNVLALTFVVVLAGCTSAEERERQEAEAKRRREAEVREVQRAQIEAHERHERERAAERERWESEALGAIQADEAERARLDEERRARARRYVETHQLELEPAIATALLEGRPEVGMSPDQARLVVDEAWIRDVISSVHGRTAIEQWVIGAPGQPAIAYLSFTNGKLTSATLHRRN